jgi:hypothetical protein
MRPRLYVKTVDHAWTGQVELLLAEVLVDERQREHVESEVPGRIPRVFPFVGHRQDVGVVHVVPVLVAGCGAPPGVRRIGSVLLEPLIDVVVEELLRPQHAGERLAHHVGRVGAQRGRNYGGVELVCFLPAQLHDGIELTAELAGLDIAQAQTKRPRFSGLHGDRIMSCRLGPRLPRVYRVVAAVDEISVETILDVRRAVGRAEEALGVGLILGEEQLGGAFAAEEPFTEIRVRGADHAGRGLPQRWPGSGSAPGPGVAKPESRQEVQRGGLRSAVRDGDLDEEVFRRGLRVFDEHVEIAVLVEHAGVE